MVRVTGTPQGDVLVDFTVVENRTVCYVSTVEVRGSFEEASFAGLGVAECSPSDSFNKKVGQQVALKLAIQDTGWNKSKKTSFWENWFTLRPYKVAQPQKAKDIKDPTYPFVVTLFEECAKYSVHFEHFYEPGDDQILLVTDGELIALPILGITKCSIVLELPSSKANLVGQGFALCSLKDQFNRSTGRKIALQRAVINAFPREERKTFWEAWFRLRGKYS